MLSNYFKIALRILIRNKTFSFINVSGLAVGMAGFILVALWIQHELKFEQFHDKKDSLYRVFTNLQQEGNIITNNTTPIALADNLKASFPEVSQVCRTSWITNHLFRVGDKILPSGGMSVEPEFLQMFHFPLAKGDPMTALQDMHSVIITENFAKELFGNQDPINKVIKLDNKDNFKVTGVLKKLPRNSSFYFNYLLPFEYFRKTLPWAENNWAANMIHTYVELQPGASLATAQQKIKNLSVQHGEKDLQLFLHPLTKWHLYSRFENGEVAGGRIEVVQFFGLIAGLLLIIAGINFMNLSTVRSEKRAKEVGIRKVMGVSQKDLILQFVGESIFFAFLAGLIALVIVWLSIPTFSELVSTDFAVSHLAINYLNPYFWLVFVLFILFTGTAAGLYPAFYLAAFKPVYVLKGIFKKSWALFSFHKVLVIGQFTCGIVLIISSIIIQQQINHAQQRDTGYNKSQLIYVQFFGDLKQNYTLLKNDLLQADIASSVTQTNSPITELWDTDSKIEWPGKIKGNLINFNILCADDDVVSTFGFEVIKGRDLDLKNFATDSMACLLNESAAKVMGFKDPVGQTIRSDGNNWKVVGIIKDFVLGSPYTITEPLVIYGAKSWFNVVHVKLNDKLPLAESLSQTEKIIKKYNPNYPFEYSFVDEAYAQKFSDEKRVAKLASLFTALTIFISCLGLFGLATFTAEQRTKEIGIRKVLGASVAQIVTLLSQDFLKLILLANLLAWPIAGWAMHQWLQGYAYRISIGWWVFALAGAAALLIAFVTLSFQAIKAAVANPVKALRNE